MAHLKLKHVFRDELQLGLTLSRGKLLWAPRGWGQWLPEGMKMGIVFVWNRVACWLLGHNDVLRSIPEEWESDGTYHCVDCCTSLGQGGNNAR